MGVVKAPVFTHDYARRFPKLTAPSHGEEHPRPQLVVLNEALALELGLDPEWLASPAGIDFLLGHGDKPVAMAYAGHQFGQLSPVLGDGRALLLGEWHTPAGDVVDLHAKGIGRTPYSRPGSDGRGTLASMLREYLHSEYLHAVGAPTARSLAVIVTGIAIQRQDFGSVPVQPAAVGVRVAASHLRIGTVQFAAMHLGEHAVNDLLDYAAQRHYPDVAEEPHPQERRRELFRRVMETQADTVAQWMRLGFIHGVMNTDNTTLSGETIDFGPCAYAENFDLDTCYSSIDTGGRYAFGRQPDIVHWNLAQFAQAIVPSLGLEWAQEVIDSFPDIWARAHAAEQARALGVSPADTEILNGWDEVLSAQHPDLNSVHRALADADEGALRDLLQAPEWVAQWRAEATPPRNPRLIPRNLRVEEALQAATEGDLRMFNALSGALQQPFTEPDPIFLQPSGDGLAGYRTFCGT